MRLFLHPHVEEQCENPSVCSKVCGDLVLRYSLFNLSVNTTTNVLFNRSICLPKSPKNAAKHLKHLLNIKIFTATPFESQFLVKEWPNLSQNSMNYCGNIKNTLSINLKFCCAKEKALIKAMNR